LVLAKNASTNIFDSTLEHVLVQPPGAIIGY
jgi:hypothetical protein